MVGQEFEGCFNRLKVVDVCETYGRTIRKSEARVRRALAAWLGTDPEKLTITLEYPKEVALLASRVSQAPFAAARAGSDAQEATIDAARQPSAMGLSPRDTTDPLGVSHQRVQQLLASSCASRCTAILRWVLFLITCALNRGAHDADAARTGEGVGNA